jgi:hypothetical protein
MTGQSAEPTSARRAAWCAWLVPLLLWGCSGDSPAARQAAEQRMPRPAMILVHDFAVSPDQVERRPWVGTRLVQDTDRTASEEAVGHAFADAFASARVDELRTLGRPAERAGAANLPSGSLATIEGRFISLAGDPSAPGMVGFAGDRPDVIADVQLYGTDQQGEQLSDELEVSVSHGGDALADALLPDPTITAGQIATAPAPSPAQMAKLTAAAREAAGKVVEQLEPYFADQGWIPRPQS